MAVFVERSAVVIADSWQYSTAHVAGAPAVESSDPLAFVIVWLAAVTLLVPSFRFLPSILRFALEADPNV
jgi:hypothetical protein